MSASDRPPHAGNKLLAALAPKDFARLRPHLSTVRLRHKDVLMEAGEPIKAGYFPHASVISDVSVMADGSTAEVAAVGPEGFSGFAGLLGSDIAVSRSIVQIDGEASRVDLARIRDAMRQSESLQRVMLRYIRSAIVQLSQSVACNSLHTVEQRTARWLLMAHERAGRSSFAMTQEALAEMLGVRRASVTMVARTFRSAGIIRYNRGILTIVDREGLENAACECYGVVRRAFESLGFGTGGNA